MGGSGNSSRSPSIQGEGVKPTAAPTEKTPSEDREPRQKGEGGQKKPELFQSQETKDLKAKELEQKRAVKAMDSSKRIEHFASKTMKERHIKAEYKKWEKAGSPGGHQKGWVENKLSKINKGWERGGKKNWIKSNKKAAQTIRSKATREEAWRKNPKQFG